MTLDVESHYSQLSQGEWDRLEGPFFRLEFLSTMRLIDKYFPGSGRVLDVGGGPGRYTIQLLQKGYTVTLLDLSPELVELGRQRIDALGLKAEGLYVGDARDLKAFDNGSFDLALVMGPLYHLSDRGDRLQVLKEARRVLKAGGRALVAYLNAWGLMRTGLTDFPEKFENPEFVRSLFDQGGLGIWYWSNPNLARDELREAGFQVVAYGGMEGFAGGMAEAVRLLAKEHPHAYEEVLKAAIESSELPQYRDSTDHVHFIVT